MYAIIVGAGKVGLNLARELIDKEHEVTLLESDRRRYLVVEDELEHAVQYGDATELWVLERAGIQPAVSATDLILRLIEHEVPRYGLVHLLALEEERLEIIELEVDAEAPTVGERIADIALPEGSLIISVLREGAGFVPKPDTVIEAGDGVLLVLNPGLEAAITAYFAPDGRGGG